MIDSSELGGSGICSRGRQRSTGRSERNARQRFRRRGDEERIPGNGAAPPAVGTVVHRGLFALSPRPPADFHPAAPP
ncbi:MAG TPA: hypothetical protein PLW65_12095, partial [Pseudomonadota bacterium]|nr:hypothetical protein [Pseudomonadota bacterium]